MSLTIDELIEKSKDQRKRKRFDEAVISAIAALDLDPDNSDAWWELGLSRFELADYEKAVGALRKTVELSPYFAYGWTKLGKAYLQVGDEEKAKASFEMAVELENEEYALEPLAKIYRNENDEEQDEAEIAVLGKLDDYQSLDTYQLNRLGNLHYRNKNYFEAIKFWKRDVSTSFSIFSRFNIGLAYSQISIPQLADAIDMCRLVLKYDPDYDRALQHIAKTLPALIIRAEKTRDVTCTILSEDEWYRFYLNPFQLIDAPDDLEIEDFDPKIIQKLKKKLLQEIDLEDGAISWLDGFVVDKSRAISLCDELNDESLRLCHWAIFSCKSLLDFLHKGSFEHFFVDEDESPLDIIETIENDDGFLEWLSEPFSKQYDLVLSNTLRALSGSSFDEQIFILNCLLDGRRWVSSSYEDRCFENSRKLIDKLLMPLRDAAISAENEETSLTAISDLVKRKGLASLFNILPVYFNDYRNEAVGLIREIAVDCYKLSEDYKSTKGILDLTNLFAYKSSELIEKIREDFKSLEDIDKRERKDETKLTRGSVKWEITKEGVTKGDRFISTKDVSSIRFGVEFTDNYSIRTYEYLLVVKTDDGRVSEFKWDAHNDINTNRDYFDNLVNASISYLLPAVLARIESKLEKGGAVKIGICRLSKYGIDFETSGWFSTKTHSIPWRLVSTSIKNGQITIRDISSPKINITMPLRDTDNAIILNFMAHDNN